MKKQFLLLALINGLHAASDPDIISAESSCLPLEIAINQCQDSTASRKLSTSEENELKALGEVRKSLKLIIQATAEKIRDLEIKLFNKLQAYKEEIARIEEYNRALRLERNLAMIEALAPLRKEKDDRRASVSAEVEKLRSHLRALELNRLHHQKSFKYKGLDDTSHQIEALKDRIDELYASAEGDINKRMDDVEQTIEHDYEKKMLKPSLTSFEIESMHQKTWFEIATQQACKLRAETELAFIETAIQ